MTGMTYEGKQEKTREMKPFVPLFFFISGKKKYKKEDQASTRKTKIE